MKDFLVEGSGRAATVADARSHRSLVADCRSYRPVFRGGMVGGRSFQPGHSVRDFAAGGGADRGGFRHKCTRIIRLDRFQPQRASRHGIGKRGGVEYL